MKKNLLFLPGPVTVAEPVLAAMSKPLIDHRGPEFGHLLERIIGRLHPIFQTQSDIVLLGSSGTGGLEAAIGCMFGPGDTILACPMGVFGRRMVAIARTFGCAVETLDVKWGEALSARALQERLNADAHAAIAGILITHNETSTGVQCDLAAIAAVTRNHPAFTVIDSVSGLGATPFHMDDWRFDAVVSASQKVFSAPPGIAMVAVSDRAWRKMEPANPRSFYFDLRKAREFARSGQTPWTPPISTLFALDVALERYEDEGADEVYRRHASYAQAIRAAFAALGMEIFSNPDAHSPTVVAASLPAGVDAAKVLRQLRESRGVVLSGGQLELKGKILRMGTMGDISQTDVLGALGALEMALLDCGAPIRVGAGVQAALRVFLNEAATTRGGARKTDASADERTTAASH